MDSTSGENIRSKKLWHKLTGHPAEFSMENRAFNAVSVITMILLMVVLPINIVIGLPKVALMIAAVLVIQFLFYYASRFKRKFSSSIIAYAIFTYLTLTANFFLDAGTYGPTFIVFCLSFLLLTALTPKTQHWIWAVAHIAIAIVLTACEYIRPDWVPTVYRSKNDHTFDIIATYGIVIVFIYFVVGYLRNSYKYEKDLAVKRAIDIEQQHLLILAQNKQLEKNNEEKDKLFSIISHDLRSPLNSIQGYLEIINQTDIDQAEKDEMKRELLDLTKSTSDMLLNLLSWSKAQMQGVKVQRRPLNFNEAINHAIEFQRSIAAKKGIQIATTLNPAIQVFADEDMLELVVRNLVNNSIKFTKPGGIISLSAKQHGNKAELCIKDTGIGISAEQQKEIFTLKSKSTYGTTNEKGMGLGLMLCKEFIELQNGSIRFSSQPGKGSEFTIELPLFVSSN